MWREDVGRDEEGVAAPNCKAAVIAAGRIAGLRSRCSCRSDAVRRHAALSSSSCHIRASGARLSHRQLRRREQPSAADARRPPTGCWTSITVYHTHSPRPPPRRTARNPGLTGLGRSSQPGPTFKLSQQAGDSRTGTLHQEEAAGRLTANRTRRQSYSCRYKAHLCVLPARQHAGRICLPNQAAAAAQG